MMPDSKVEIIDITKKSEHERYLYRCLAPMPFRKYKKRHDYLEVAIRKGFTKKILIFNLKVVGQIEYDLQRCLVTLLGATTSLL